MDAFGEVSLGEEGVYMYGDLLMVHDDEKMIDVGVFVAYFVFMLLLSNLLEKSTQVVITSSYILVLYPIYLPYSILPSPVLFPTP